MAPAAPAEGRAFEVSELSRRGLDKRRIALTLGFEQCFSLRVFLLVNALNLGWILATPDLPVDATWPLVTAPLVLVALVVTAILANRPQVRRPSRSRLARCDSGYGPPFAAALAAALVYRVLGTFLPAAAGAVALFALRASQH